MSASILVVEDDPDLLALVEMILADAGYRVATAPDGRAALARVAREFRARYGRAAPIVVVTAADNARARAEEIGAEGWLAKPFELDDVLRAAERHAGRPGVDGSAARR